jgi:hypothetical protein
MKRALAIGTVLGTITALGGLGATAAQAATPRGPIVINTDSAFTAANGVTNAPNCGGAMQAACRINDWQITPSAGGTCINIENTMKRYLIENNSCDGGRNGIVLVDAPNGTVKTNTIKNLSGIPGAAGNREAYGIKVLRSDTMTITDNQLNKIQGDPGSSAGQNGASAYGISVQDSPTVDLARNNISRVSGGYGFMGSGTSTNGGPGGSAYGIFAQKNTATLSIVLGPVNVHLGPALSELLEPVVTHLPAPVSSLLTPVVVPPKLTVKDNVISQVSGGVGAIGAYVFGGTGGNGGNGGSATGVSVAGLATSSYSAVSMTGNNISGVFGAVGAIGGGGKNGGKGGSGGSGQGIVLANVTNAGSAVTGNTISQLYGGVGALGGTGTFGSGVGGSGGNGGDAVGIRKGSTSPGFNSITFFFAGLRGNGGFPGGANGTNGTAAAVL